MEKLLIFFINNKNKAKNMIDFSIPDTEYTEYSNVIIKYNDSVLYYYKNMLSNIPYL